MPFDLLMLESLARVESPLVEYLRSEVAELRVQAPRLFQEQALIGGDRLLPGEQVFKSRNSGTVRMAALDRLLQLLRVTKQNDIFRGLRDGQHIRQRHLSRLVNEKNVYRFEVLFPRPKPGGATDDLNAATQSRKRLRVICR